MTRLKLRLLIVLFFSLIAIRPVVARGQVLEELLTRAPSPANSICYMHVPSLNKLMQEASLKSLLTEKVTELRLTADLDPETLQPVWEAGIATLNESVDVKTLAAAMQGNIEPLAGKQAVWTPMQSYLVPLGSNRIAFIRPAKRDKASAWLGSNGSMSVAAYLAEQAKQPEQYLSFMLALALKDYFSATRLVSHLQEFESLKGQDLTAVADILASVQGVSIIVGRESLSECIVSIEFAQSPTSLQSVADKMFSELLVRHGTPAPEVATWKVAVKGNTLSFQGALSEDSLDEVLNIFSALSHAEHVATTVTAHTTQTAEAAAAGAAADAGPSDSQLATLTKAYFDKVNAFIERVRKYKAQTAGFRAKWDETQARRIAEISTLHVDRDVVDYGTSVVALLRGNAGSIRTTDVKSGQTQAAESAESGSSTGGGKDLGGMPISTMRGGYGYGRGIGGGFGGGYYGSYGLGTGYAAQFARSGGQAGAAVRSYSGRYQVSAQQVTGAQASMSAFDSYRDAQDKIDDLTEQVRRDMTDRYQIQF